MASLRSIVLLVASLLSLFLCAASSSIPGAPANLGVRDANAAAAPSLELPPGSPPTKRRPPARPAKGKYFHEPGRDDNLGHYDDRFFKGIVPYEEHRPALRHLIRSYLTAFRALGVETWLAHGTLLGWWWNGKIMPWDYDLDVQVSDVTLYYLGEHFNRTIHTYRYHDDAAGEDVVKKYLLDINPNHGLPRGDGLNIIDARWIDMSNGMFIDITGLAEREPKRSPGIWSCKNFHRYRTRELYPMRETEFEGVPATVPYSFNKILTDEYGQKSLVITEWEDHKWNPELKEWVRFASTKPKSVAAKLADQVKANEKKKAKEAAKDKTKEKSKAKSGGLLGRVLGRR